MFYTYIIQCADKTYYCGYTTNLKDRVNDHNESTKGAKYTKSRRPTKLVYSEEFDSKSGAMKREAEIKKLSRLQKKSLILLNKHAQHKV